MYIFSYLFLSKWLFAYQFQVINKQGATRCALEYITVLACRQDNADVVSSVCQFLRIYCFSIMLIVEFQFKAGPFACFMRVGYDSSGYHVFMLVIVLCDMTVQHLHIFGLFVK